MAIKKITGFANSADARELHAVIAELTDAVEALQAKAAKQVAKPVKRAVKKEKASC
jgi:hypothetical protein